MSEGYWYPSNSRLSELQRELSTLNQQMVRSDYTANGEFVPLVLKALIRSNTVTGFPSHQIDRWIWVALQFQLAKDENILEAARGALTYVTRLIARNWLSDADVKDINWILDSTIHLMTKNPNVQSTLIARNISSILSELNIPACPQKFDIAAIKNALALRIEDLAALSSSPTFATILGKLDALFEATEADNFEGDLAKRALSAFADRCVKDRELLGRLNIMRDVNLIEAAYASVAHRTRYLPLLNRLLARWPFVHSLPIIGQNIRPLDRYAQYVASVCLHCLFDRKSTLLVLRNNSVHCIIAAVMAAIETMRRETDLTNLGLSTWRAGQAITISDGTLTFKATFIRALEISAKKKVLLGVRGNGSITVDDSILPFIAAAAEPHKVLSPGADILIWLKRRHPDPLIFLTGSSRRRLMHQECILLLTAKNKFDEYTASVRPLNASPAALFGLTYVSSRHEFENLSGTAVEISRIFVCSDVDVAADLIREPPKHIGAWRIIVDGARNGAALLAAFPNLSESNAQSICVVGDLHERESCSEIIAGEIAGLYLEDTHVEIPPAPLSAPRQLDGAERMLLCQRSHSVVSTEFYSVNDVFLEDLSLKLKNRDRKPDPAQTTMLDLLLTEFLKRGISRPVGSETTRNALRAMAQRIVAQASVDRLYDQAAEKIFVLFKAYLTSADCVFDRSVPLRKIAESVRHSETVAVLCRSENIAKECFEALPSDSDLRKFAWVGIQSLRKFAPWDRIIVAGWLDRFAMRELNNSGYGSHLDFVLLPFERDWFESTITANRRFEKNLDAAGRKLLADLETDFTVQYDEMAGEAPQNEKSLDAVVTDFFDQQDITELERVEARALDAMLRMVAQPKAGQTTAAAQLVIFEETGSYAYLPPAGKVIVLPGQGARLDEQKLAAGLAEQLLFRSVGDLAPGMVLALPVETDRDLVDARADQFLQNPSQVRLAAAMWKDAIRRYIGRDPTGHVRFAKSLSEAGRSREPNTVRSWVSHSATVAPSNYRELIPLIAKLTNDVELKAQCVQVMQSVDQIYRAKARAADAIVRELFSGAIDVEQDELSFDLNGHKLRYELRHVKSLAGIRKVPSELIGKSARVAGTEAAFSSAVRSIMKLSEAGEEAEVIVPTRSSLADDLPSIDLPTTLPSELVNEQAGAVETATASSSPVPSTIMIAKSSEDAPAVTAPALSSLADDLPSIDLPTTLPSELVNEQAGVAETATASSSPLPSTMMIVKSSEEGTAVTAPALSSSADDLASIDLPTTLPSEPVNEQAGAVEAATASSSPLPSTMMIVKSSEEGTAVTGPALSSLADDLPSIDLSTMLPSELVNEQAGVAETETAFSDDLAKLPPPKQIEYFKAAIFGNGRVSDRTGPPTEVDFNAERAPRSYKVAGVDVQINFNALASLRKWPSLGNTPIPGRKPYLLTDDTLGGCIRKFTIISPSQQHLYEIHTSPQPPLVTAIILADHVVQLARLQDDLPSQLEKSPLACRFDDNVEIGAPLENGAVPATRPVQARPRGEEHSIGITGTRSPNQRTQLEALLPIASNTLLTEGLVVGQRTQSSDNELSDTTDSADDSSSIKSRPERPERSTWRL